MEEARRFWEWFANNASRIAQVRSAEDPLFEELNSWVRRFDEHLVVEVSGSENSDAMELILSAGGDERLFATVDALVELAPQIGEWEIHALRPPLGEDAKIFYEGMLIESADLSFCILSNKGERPLKIALLIAGADPSHVDAAQDVAFLLLQSVLGERLLTTAVEVSEVRLVERNAPIAGSRPIRELIALAAH